jgi:hypothetical protein
VEEYVIDATREQDGKAPIKLINSICVGKGGIIRIEPGAYPPKILWTLKSLLTSISVGYQWATIEKLVAQGAHAEHAEHHVNTMLNKLVVTEVPPMPSPAEIAEVVRRYKEEAQGGEDGSSNQIPEQDIS